MYVKLARGLQTRRKLAHLTPPTQEQEAEIAEQLDQLWTLMDDAEQARVESILEQ